MQIHTDKANKAKNKQQLMDGEQISKLSPYPIDLSNCSTLSQIILDDTGIPYQENQIRYDPTIITQYALSNWNKYLTLSDSNHYQAFLRQADWLIENVLNIEEDGAGWPIFSPHPNFHTKGPWLSALTQGNALSVLIRAYQITSERKFLDLAHRVVNTFERDILDGGVCAPIGEEGVFFEMVSVYPASHILSGFIFALFGLYDYEELTGEARIGKLISLSLTTMHQLLVEYDLGYWTRPDLLRRQLSSPAHLALQTMLLEALSKRSGCGHCLMLASTWRTYQNDFLSRLHYFISRNCSYFGQTLLKRVQTKFFPKPYNITLLRICVPITGFPIMGGTHTFLANIDRVMDDKWQLEYVTQHIGSHPEGFTITRFGSACMSPWQFPSVWLYCLSGFGKLISQYRHGSNFSVILPQDGVFTSAFASLVGKIIGVRVVCIDHGNLTLLKSQIYRTERIQALVTKSWLSGSLCRFLYMWYWPSLYQLARISARFVDHFLIPGIAGDGAEEVGKSLGIAASRLTRIRSVIDIDRYIPLDDVSKTKIREQNGINADAIVITMISRLTPEKGIDIALNAVSQALTSLKPALRDRVRIIIAGDGPLRKQIESDILKRKLSQTFLLWGEASATEVISILRLTDIFLYTSTRGACLSMAVLEAMASGCAVVATTLPLANVQMLADGRGITVSPAAVEETSMALVRLLNDPDLCRRMGNLARDYVAIQHNSTIFKRVLLRATGWSALDEILTVNNKSQSSAIEKIRANNGII